MERIYLVVKKWKFWNKTKPLLIRVVKKISWKILEHFSAASYFVKETLILPLSTTSVS